LSKRKTLQISKIQIVAGDEKLDGHVVEPRTGLPGVLFVHGWGGSQERDMERARLVSRLGCVCLTFDMRGHGATAHRLTSVNRDDNLADLCAAYDVLVAQPGVDASSIAVVGSSYGGYLAAYVTAMRPVRWLALRVPAMYRDEDWDTPKFELDRAVLAEYRQRFVSYSENSVLDRCRQFKGDVLIVESEHDEIVPHPAVASYVSSFVYARSVTYRVMSGADHALTDAASRREYDRLLEHWLREMIFGAR
jgi:uncharacterized protein